MPDQLDEPVAEQHQDQRGGQHQRHHGAGEGLLQQGLCVLLPVSTTTDSNAPGVAMAGMASGKTAASCPLSGTPSFPEDFSKIIVSENRNSTIPPAIWNESNSIRITFSNSWPK